MADTLKRMVSSGEAASEGKAALEGSYVISFQECCREMKAVRLVNPGHELMSKLEAMQAAATQSVKSIMERIVQGCLDKMKIVEEKVIDVKPMLKHLDTHLLSLSQYPHKTVLTECVQELNGTVPGMGIKHFERVSGALASTDVKQILGHDLSSFGDKVRDSRQKARRMVAVRGAARIILNKKISEIKA